MKRIFLLIWLLLACGSAAANAQEDATPVIHIVMVWLEDSVTPQQRDDLIAQTQNLAEIPGISKLHVAKAIPSERSIVDDSFSFGVSMEFPDQATMQAYLSHPQHLAFVQNDLKPLLKKLLVYDF